MSADPRDPRVPWNIKITDRYGSDLGREYIPPEDEQRLTRLKREIAELRAESPAMDYHVLTCGTELGWHRAEW